jgi:hypothetical protein
MLKDTVVIWFTVLSRHLCGFSVENHGQTKYGSFIGFWLVENLAELADRAHCVGGIVLFRSPVCYICSSSDWLLALSGQELNSAVYWPRSEPGVSRINKKRKCWWPESRVWFYRPRIPYLRIISCLCSAVMYSWCHLTVALDIIVDCRPIAVWREFRISDVPVCKPLTTALLAVKV